MQESKEEVVGMKERIYLDYERETAEEAAEMTFIVFNMYYQRFKRSKRDADRICALGFDVIAPIPCKRAYIETRSKVIVIRCQILNYKEAK